MIEHEGERYEAKPPLATFCDDSNQCRPGTVTPQPPNYPGDPGTGEGDVRGEPAGPCWHTAPSGEFGETTSRSARGSGGAATPSGLAGG